MYWPGATSQIDNELEARNTDITAVQKIRWTGTRTVKIGKAAIFYSENDQGIHHFGTGFIVTEKIAGLVLDLRPVSEWLCYIRIKEQLYNFSVHAKTVEKDEQIKNTFYDQLDNLIGCLPKHDMLIIEQQQLQTIFWLNRQCSTIKIYRKWQCFDRR